MGREDAMRSLTALERLHQQLGSATQKEEEGWKQNYLRLRRELQEQIARLAQVDCVALGMTEEDNRIYREAFNRFRSATAMHQANWPVVAIVADDPEYRVSVEGVRAATENFVQVMRRLFGPPGSARSPI